MTTVRFEVHSQVLSAWPQTHSPGFSREGGWLSLDSTGVNRGGVALVADDNTGLYVGGP